MPQLPDGALGVRLGSGVVVRVLGEGGAAVVYEVHNRHYGVYRAVKVLKPGVSAAVRRRFEREIRIMPLLHHPNIVRVYDVGWWHGLPYLEMERVNGISLDVLLARRGALPARAAMAIAIGICRALAYVHTHEFTIGGRNLRGILHRDLKPANIMISALGQIKLTDFGAARPLRAVDPDEEEVLVGSLQYVAPEELRGKAVDQRSDIYSAGCVLYEMLTGKRVFPQTNITELLHARATNTYHPMAQRWWGVSRRFRELVDRCLAFDPERRPRSVDILHGHLATLLRRYTRQSVERVVRTCVRESVAIDLHTSRRPTLSHHLFELLRRAGRRWK